MNEAGAFAAKLSLVLKALSLSRGRLAAEIGVDKSLVSRWCAGNFIPAPHNLSRLSQAIAARKPGFSMAGWDADIDTLASRFGVEVSPPPDTQRGAPSGIAEWLMIPKLREAAMSSGAVAAAVAGFWRTTRPYPEWPGRYLRDPLYLRPTPDGPLAVKVGILSSRMEGWGLAVGDQLFICVTDDFYGYSTFCVFNHIARGRVDAMDGLLCAALRGDGGVPTACSCIIERVEDLDGDPVVDEARYQALLAENPLAPEGSVPDVITDRLMSAAAPVREPFLRVPSVTSIARAGKR